MPDSSPDIPTALQERSRRTHDRIYLAGTKLLEDGGPDALTVANVAAAADVSVGGIYRRFGSKEQLLAVIQYEFVEGFKVEFASRMARARLTRDASSVDVVGAAVGGFAETFQEHRALLRVFMLLGTENAGVLALGSRASIECGASFRELLLRMKGQIRRADVEVAIDFAFRLVYATCAHRVVFGEKLESLAPLTWADLIREMTSAVHAYLTGPEAPTTSAR